MGVGSVATQKSEQSVLHVDNHSYYVNCAVNKEEPGSIGSWECDNSNLNRVYYMLTMTAIMSTVLYMNQRGAWQYWELGV